MITSFHVVIDPFLQRRVDEDQNPHLKQSLATALRLPGDVISLGMRYGSLSPEDVPAYLQTRWKWFYGGRAEGAELSKALHEVNHCHARLKWVIEDTVSVELTFILDTSADGGQRTTLTIDARIQAGKVIGQERTTDDA